jgi:hypothetical protein
MITKSCIVLSVALWAGVSTASSADRPLTDIQREVFAAQQRVDAEEQARAQLHREIQEKSARVMATRAAADNAAPPAAAKKSAALAQAVAAYSDALKQEDAMVVGALQANAALRRSRQTLMEAVSDYVEQGDALERAAARAARGEVAPSVSDLLACDGPDCAPVSVREHAALALMGAVGPGFDMASWPPEGAASPITVLARNTATAPLIADLRRVAQDAGESAQSASAAAARARQSLAGPAPQDYGRLLAAADVAARARDAAEDRLQHAVDSVANMGRALKRAARLAGDGYALKANGRAACAVDCIPAQGLEAAAFVVMGAIQNDRNGRLKDLETFLIRTEYGVAFRLPDPPTGSANSTK